MDCHAREIARPDVIFLCVSIAESGVEVARVRATRAYLRSRDSPHGRRISERLGRTTYIRLSQPNAETTPFLYWRRRGGVEQSALAGPGWLDTMQPGHGSAACHGVLRPLPVSLLVPSVPSPTTPDYNTGISADRREASTLACGARGEATRSVRATRAYLHFASYEKLICHARGVDIRLSWQAV